MFPAGTGCPLKVTLPEHWKLQQVARSSLPPAEPGDNKWYSNNPQWQRQWYDRIRELVDNYKPDLLYTDGKVPFENEVGLSMIAHLYNSNPQVVYNCKQQQAEGRWVEDLERGVMPGIHPHPWQTDTSIGDWFYNRNWEFRPVSWTIHMLCDIVSKNGNLLLNIVQRPDGSLDPEVEQQLEDLAKWIAIHGEAIHGTRPWLVYGEGGVRTKGGHFKEDFKYGASDIRFTTKGGTLYAIALGWPADGKLLVKSLATPAGEITGVTLLGSKSKLNWKQTSEGLVVTLPAERISEFTAALKVTGKNLKPAPVPLEPVIVQADAKGDFKLDANDADLHGDGIKVKLRDVHASIGAWDNPGAWAAWKVQFEKPGAYEIRLDVAAVHPGIEAAVEIVGETFIARIPQTGDLEKFQACMAGKIEIRQAGIQTLKVRAADAANWNDINLRLVRLSPAQ